MLNIVPVDTEIRIEFIGFTAATKRICNKCMTSGMAFDEVFFSEERGSTNGEKYENKRKEKDNNCKRKEE